MTSWLDLTTPTTGRELRGEGSFRLLPTDELSSGPATGSVDTYAGGYAALVAYTWTHPADGPQDGVLLIGSPEEGGQASATLLDSWHQKPGPMHLTGVLDGTTVRLAGTYFEVWGWQVDVTVGIDGLHLVMRNVVPQSAVDEAPPEMAGVEAGPYDVMDLRLG